MESFLLITFSFVASICFLVFHLVLLLLHRCVLNDIVVLFRFFLTVVCTISAGHGLWILSMSLVWTMLVFFAVLNSSFISTGVFSFLFLLLVDSVCLFFSRHWIFGFVVVFDFFWDVFVNSVIIFWWLLVVCIFGFGCSLVYLLVFGFSVVFNTLLILTGFHCVFS